MVEEEIHCAPVSPVLHHTRYIWWARHAGESTLSLNDHLWIEIPIQSSWSILMFLECINAASNERYMKERGIFPLACWSIPRPNYDKTSPKEIWYTQLGLSNPRSWGAKAQCFAWADTSPSPPELVVYQVRFGERRTLSWPRREKQGLGDQSRFFPWSGFQASLNTSDEKWK